MVNATQEIAAAVTKAAADVLSRHPDEPDAVAHVAAGFAMALRVMGSSIDPRVPLICL